MNKLIVALNFVMNSVESNISFSFLKKIHIFLLIRSAYKILFIRSSCSKWLLAIHIVSTREIL